MHNLNPPLSAHPVSWSRWRCLLVMVILVPLVMLPSACNKHDNSVTTDTHTLPATPRLRSMENFRDLAGADAQSVYYTKDGRALRRGVFYRSDAVTPDDADLVVLTSLGISKVHDLRTPDEIAKEPDRLPQGASYVHINLLGREAIALPVFTSPEQAAQLLEDYKRKMITDTDVRARLAQLLTDMASTDGAQIFHCTAGKDRTGWVAALLLSIAGVPEDLIIQDYLLSNTYAQQRTQRSRQEMLEKRGPAFVEMISPLFGVQERFLRAGFDQAIDSYGSMDHYVSQGLGLETQVIETLRDKLLE